MGRAPEGRSVPSMASTLGGWAVLYLSCWDILQLRTRPLSRQTDEAPPAPHMSTNAEGSLDHCGPLVSPRYQYLRSTVGLCGLARWLQPPPSAPHHPPPLPHFTPYRSHSSPPVPPTMHPSSRTQCTPLISHTALPIPHPTAPLHLPHSMPHGHATDPSTSFTHTHSHNK